MPGLLRKIHIILLIQLSSLLLVIINDILSPLFNYHPTGNNLFFTVVKSYFLQVCKYEKLDCI